MMKAYEKAVNEDDDMSNTFKNTESEIYYHRCLCYEKLGKHALAADDRRSKPYRSRFAPVVNHPDRQRSLEAIVEYSKSIAHKPDDSVAYLMRGWNYLQLGETQKSAHDLSDCIKLDEHNGKAFYLRALCHEKLGPTAKARMDKMQAQELGIAEADDLDCEFMPRSSGQ